jgi:predicted nucleic acid-binding protein
MVTQKTFIDTQAFFSALSAEDRHHQEVDAILNDRTRAFYTTDWVVGETVNLLTARRRAHLGIRLLEMLDSSPDIHLVHGGEKLYRETCALLRKYRDHTFPFTDCTSFVVMREYGITDALTSDRHFRVLGFHPLLAE